MNSKKTAIIIDDETNARLSLKGMLEEYFTDITIVGEAKDVPDGVKLIHATKPQIVFLDIEMPGHSGLTLLDFFDKTAIDFKIIFVTAYSEYALNAFELAAIDYILKPVKKVDLQRALLRVNDHQTQQLDVLKINQEPNSDKKIALNTSQGLLFVHLNEIIYLKADGSYTHIYLTNNRKITVTKRLNEYERLEKVGRFLRIHRSQIINLNHISRILKQDGGTVIMSNSEELSISNEKKQLLLDTLEEERF